MNIKVNDVYGHFQETQIVIDTRNEKQKAFAARFVRNCATMEYDAVVIGRGYLEFITVQHSVASFPSFLHMIASTLESETYSP